MAESPPDPSIAAEPAPGLTLRAIADALSAQRIGVEVVGDPQRRVRRPVSPLAAMNGEDIAIAIEGEAVQALARCPSATALVPAGSTPPVGGPQTYLRVEEPRYALAILLRLLNPPPAVPPGIHPSAVVEPTAEVAAAAAVGPLCYVGASARIGDGSVLVAQVTVGAGARVGAGCLLHPGARIGARVVVGDRCILQHNASIGADGFGYATPEIGPRWRETPQRPIMRIDSLGTVVLGDEVEVGAGSTIDRATLGATRLGRGTKVDNLVMIGHNTTIGEDCLICGLVGVSGSCRIGNRVVLAGGVGIADHLTIGDGAIVMARAGVGRHVAAGAIVGGTPAVPRDQFFEQIVGVQRLKKMHRDLVDLQQRLHDLETALAARDGAS
jgi:UDP-3-O-[3-hydroxymyristoyl] glucosamine N-acyltransferase